jgi:hypothetical protein
MLVDQEDIAGEIAYIVSPETKKRLRDFERWVGSGSNCWEHMRGFSSNQVSTEEIYFGVFPQMTIGLWAADILINPYTRATGGMVELLLNLFCSVAIKRPGCFGIINTSFSLPPEDSRRYQPKSAEPASPGPASRTGISFVGEPGHGNPGSGNPQMRKGQKGWQR